MKPTIAISLLLGLALLSSSVEARGRFERGRTVYQRRCAPCFAIGWKWAPRPIESWRSLELLKKARTWHTSKVCTWMRKNDRQRVRAMATRANTRACYPMKMTPAEKLNALYYVARRAQGKFQKPRLRKHAAQRYRGQRFKSRVKGRRKTALKRLKQLMLLRRMRGQTRRSVGRPGTKRQGRR